MSKRMRKRRRNLKRQNKIYLKPRKRSQRRKLQKLRLRRRNHQRRLSQQSQLRLRRKSQRRLLNNQRLISFKKLQRKLRMKLLTKNLTKSIIRSTITKSITRKKKVMTMVRLPLKRVMKSQLLRKHLLLKLSLPRKPRSLRRTSTPFFKTKMMLTVMTFSVLKSLRIRKL